MAAAAAAASLAIAILCSFSLVSSAPESALVTNLPGFVGTFPSKHYAG